MVNMALLHLKPLHFFLNQIIVELFALQTLSSLGHSFIWSDIFLLEKSYCFSAYTVGANYLIC